MPMMLALPLCKSVPSLGRTTARCGGFGGQSIGESVGTKIQLMPMMLALLLSNSVQPLDRTATRAVGSEARRWEKENWKERPTDADDAGPPAS